MTKVLKIILLIFIFNLSSNIVIAESKTSLGISPAIIENVIKPGDSYKTKIKVFNLSETPIPLKIFAQSFATNEVIDTTKVDFFDSASWISIEPEHLILLPNDEKEVELIINVPAAAEPGGHYATVVLQPLTPVEDLNNKESFISSRIAALTLIIVEGDIIQSAKLKNFEFNKISTDGPPNFRFTIENNGNVHTTPNGYISVKNIFGKKIKEFNINNNIVLPYSSKKFEILWVDKPIFPGIYKLEINLTYGPNHEILMKETKTFFVILSSIEFILICILTLFFTFLIINRRRIKPAFSVLFKNNN